MQYKNKKNKKTYNTDIQTKIAVN